MSAAGGAQGNDQDEGRIVVAGGELRHVVMGHQHIESQTVMSHTYNPVGASGIAVEPGIFAIQSNILVHELNPISTSSRVFNAELRSGVTGTKPIVVKLTPHGPKFLREAKIHFSVPHHKNIVERIATDFFNFRGVPTIFIAMERCDCNLHDHIQSEVKDKVAFNSAKYTWISYQILVALDFLHSHSVVHGDLKPSNVLLILNGNFVKLCDFGLSRAITEGLDSTQLTSPQGGTSGWLAPESLSGATRISKTSDIFPCGLVFHFTWSFGKHAYGDNHVSRNHFIMVGENRDLSRMLIDFVDEATTLLEKMFQYNPADRPTTAEVLQSPIFRRFGTQQNDNRVDNAQVLEVFHPPIANEQKIASDSINIIEGGKQPTAKELHTIISKAVKHMECQNADGGNEESTTEEKTALGVTVEQIANAINELKLSRKVRKVKALFGYDAMHDDELSFKEGTIFQLLDDFEDGWSEGLLDGKIGSFPRLYIRPLEEGEDDVKKPVSTASNNSSNTCNGIPLCQQGCGLVLTSHLSSDSKHLPKLSSELFGTTMYNPTGEFISESNRKAIQKRLSNMKTCNDGITMIFMTYSHSLKVYDALTQDNLKKFLEEKGLSDDECVVRIKDIRNNLAVFNFRPGGRYLGQDAAKIAINICLTKDKNDESGKLQTTVKNGCTVDKITFQESQGTGSWLGPDMKHFVNNVEVMEFVKRKLARLGIAEFCKQHQVEKQAAK